MSQGMSRPALSCEFTGKADAMIRDPRPDAGSSAAVVVVAAGSTSPVPPSADMSMWGYDGDLVELVGAVEDRWIDPAAYDRLSEAAGAKVPPPEPANADGTALMGSVDPVVTQILARPLGGTWSRSENVPSGFIFFL